MVFYQKREARNGVVRFGRQFSTHPPPPSLATKGVRSDFEGGRSGQVSPLGFVPDSLGLRTSNVFDDF